ncbi:MAG: Lacal_2735 family protein [Balneolales bacterium]|nr:Lacal_2735 family protein [Balneolales bacterium]
MFGLFKKKSELDKLDAKYRKLLAEAHQASTSNRTLSDQKMEEANKVLKQMDQLLAQT